MNHDKNILPMKWKNIWSIFAFESCVNSWKRWEGRWSHHINWRLTVGENKDVPRNIPLKSSKKQTTPNASAACNPIPNSYTWKIMRTEFKTPCLTGRQFARHFGCRQKNLPIYCFVKLKISTRPMSGDRLSWRTVPRSSNPERACQFKNLVCPQTFTTPRICFWTNFLLVANVKD